MTSCFKLIKAEATQSFTSGSFQRGTVSFASSLLAQVWGTGGEHPHHLRCSCRWAGNKLLSQPQQKGWNCWMQTAWALCHTQGKLCSFHCYTGRGKVKPLLGMKGQMQNKQLQARLESKSWNRCLKPSSTLGHEHQQYFFPLKNQPSFVYKQF